MNATQPSVSKPDPARTPVTVNPNGTRHTSDQAELIYPGEGNTKAAARQDASIGTKAISHTAFPPTMVPRNKVHTGTPEASPLLDALSACIQACGHCMEACGTEEHKYAEVMAACGACHGICSLLHDWVSGLPGNGLDHLAMELARTCAHACENCLVACSKHPGDAHCVRCVHTCRACSAQCLSFAK
ncbi:MAG: hypothetical protein J5I62_03535 [Flavobacteriales bacterium]|nr:hypothetical protein [Flavobacteriales bacterium]MEB2341175.1 hypothetical protein [Flavobacteriia bacterium]